MKGWAMALTAAIVLGRFVITPRLDLPTATGSYEAVAHIWFGVLIGVGAFAWSLSQMTPTAQGKTIRWACLPHLAAAAFITAVEIVAFSIQKLMG